jgi:hypothetical protein
VTAIWRASASFAVVKAMMPPVSLPLKPPTVSALAGAHAMNPHSAKRPAALIVRIVNSLWVGAH